jgi:hypothetical protein
MSTNHQHDHVWLNLAIIFMIAAVSANNGSSHYPFVVMAEKLPPIKQWKMICGGFIVPSWQTTKKSSGSSSSSSRCSVINNSAMSQTTTVATSSKVLAAAAASSSSSSGKMIHSPKGGEMSSRPTTRGTTATEKKFNDTPNISSHRRHLVMGNTLAMVLLPMISTVSVSLALDFDQIQDLLGPSNGYESSYNTVESSEGRRPQFLTEPTDEFKENEQKAAIFRQNLKLYQQEFTVLLNKITTDPNDEKVLVHDLDQLRLLVQQHHGLPTGTLKDDVIRVCRRRKALKYWPTNVEISYQDFINEIRYQQSPNKERDMENPF